MECPCGCGTDVPRRLTPVSIATGQVAIELLAWDKARGEGYVGAGDEAEAVIERGACRYQDLLRALHGDGSPEAAASAGEWLKESAEARKGRDHMIERGGLFTPDKLRLSEEDLERIDRRHPERSVTGGSAGERPPASPAEEGDTARQLRRLTALYAEGVLTDEELEAARSRLGG